MLVKKIIYLLFVILFTTSCYTYKSVGLMQENNFTLPEYEDSEYKDYRIRVNDEIIYRLITDDTNLTKLITSTTSISAQNQLAYRVMQDGTIDLPFVKNIYVEGLTVEEATEKVQERFREMAPDAMIKLTINKTFTVIGEISSGVYPIYKEKMTIYQALAMTGDIMQTGDRKHVKIIRETNDGPTVLEFDIRPASLINSQYYYIYPNDIIYIRKQPSSFFKVASYSGFLGIISSAINLVSIALLYTSLKK